MEVLISVFLVSFLLFYTSHDFDREGRGPVNVVTVRNTNRGVLSSSIYPFLSRSSSVASYPILVVK